MYESYYGFSDDPFRLTPDRRFCFPHQAFRKAKAYLEYGIQREEGFIMVTGAPGTGKTTLIEAVLAELDPARIRVVRLNTTRLGGTELIRMIAYSLDLKADHLDKAALFRQIIRTLDGEHRKGRRCLLVVDEAQGLPEDSLEELRFLTNLEKDGIPLLQIFLIGQENLRDLVNHPSLEQLHQRLIAACHLRPMDTGETRAYIQHRLERVGWNGDPQLDASLYPAIRDLSGGIPRRVNQICARLLMYGFVEDIRHFGREALEGVLADLVEEGLLSAGRAEAQRLVESHMPAAPAPAGQGGAYQPAAPAPPAAPRPPADSPALRPEDLRPRAPEAEPATPEAPTAPGSPVSRWGMLARRLGMGVAAVLVLAAVVYLGREAMGLPGFPDFREAVAGFSERLSGAGASEAEFRATLTLDDSEQRL